MRYKLLSAFLIATTTVFMSCDDDDSPVDPFSDLTKYGSIVITMSGTDPDGNSFSKTIDYMYMPEFSFQYSLANPGFENPDAVVFSLKRRSSVLDPVSSSDYWAEITLVADNSGSTQTFPNQRLLVAANILNEESREYFEVRADTFSAEISNYTYNQTSGKLKFTMTSTVTEQDHNLSGDLLITAEVDVTVFTQVTAN